MDDELIDETDRLSDLPDDLWRLILSDETSRGLRAASRACRSRHDAMFVSSLDTCGHSGVTAEHLARTVAGCPRLTRLVAWRSCSISVVMPPDPSKLRVLVCSHSGIADLRPLAVCRSLCFLDVSANVVKDVAPLSACTALETLDLQFNLMEDEPALVRAVAAMPCLRTLEVAGNPISAAAVARVRARFPDVIVPDAFIKISGTSKMPTLQLRKFDMSSIPATAVVAFLAPRGSGKSYCLRDCLYWHRDCPCATVVSPTESANRFFADMVPSSLIYEAVTPKLLSTVIARQKKIMMKYNREITDFGRTNIDPRTVIVLDDCMASAGGKGGWKYDPNMANLACNGRHYKALLLLTLQQPTGILPVMRQNLDYTFLFRNNNQMARKSIYQNYAGMFESYSVFCSVFDALTEDYGAMVIKNTCTSSKLEDVVFWYRAKAHPPFRMCSAEVWEAHYERLAQQKANDDDDNDGEELYDPRKNAKGSSVTVKKIG